MARTAVIPWGTPEEWRAGETESLSTIEELGRKLSAWGRWGTGDEKGALNYIGGEQRVRAASLVRTGRTFSLALPLKNGVGPQSGMLGRTNPIHVMTQTGDTVGPLEMGGDADFTDDSIVLSCQGSTQWDALAHIYYGGRMYNGVPAGEVTAAGCSMNGIDRTHSDLVGRGVLLDLARHSGRDLWDPAVPIRGDDLDACAEAQKVDIESGDIVLIRTGAMSLVDGDDWTRFKVGPLPGLHYSVAEWFARHEVAAVAADNTRVEGISPELPGVLSPLHMIAIRDMGIHLGELWSLDELATDCAEDRVYEFFLAAQALNIVGGAGSPVNPIAVK